MRITYDQEEDVLYLIFADSDEECDYVESPDGVVLRIGMQSGKVLGCTVMWFKKKLETGQKVVISEIGALPVSDEMRRLVGF